MVKFTVLYCDWQARGQALESYHHHLRDAMTDDFQPFQAFTTNSGLHSGFKQSSIHHKNLTPTSSPFSPPNTLATPLL